MAKEPLWDDEALWEWVQENRLPTRIELYESFQKIRDTGMAEVARLQAENETLTEQRNKLRRSAEYYLDLWRKEVDKVRELKTRIAELEAQPSVEDGGRGKWWSVDHSEPDPADEDIAGMVEMAQDALNRARHDPAYYARASALAAVAMATMRLSEYES